MRIVDVDDGVPTAAGRPGEIQLRGPNLMRGICGRTRAEVFTVDGFYPTGDLGYLDADGYLFFVGRRDDMFKVKGATVYPSEVEAALHPIPDVRRASSSTSATPPAWRSARSWCWQPGSRADRRRSRARRGGPAERVQGADAWAIVDADDMPMTATGKVDKAGVQRLLDGT